MEVIGRIRMIGFAQQVSPTFTKRDVVITTEEQYPQHILIEFTQDKCDLLNQFQPGEMVRVGINLRGREWTNPQGEVRYFNSIQGWRIDRPQMNQPYGGQPQPGYGQPQGFQQTPQGYGQPQPGMNQPQQGGFPPAPDFGNQEDPDDLPF